jgi:hypothetical protein
MFKTRYAIFLLTALALLVGTVAAQGAGQYLILNAQYGNERNHVDVTNHLRDLSRRGRPFRISDDSMDVDPDRGHAKAMRVFTRGPGGREQVFEFPDGSVFDGAQFWGWGRGDWGEQRWYGDWNGSNTHYAGEYVILTAQYGIEARHVDVTNRLKELARQDRVFLLDYRTFGVDPAEGRSKALHVYVKAANGQEQMVEFLDNSLIDGSIFSGWRSGNWGNGGWSGNWNSSYVDLGAYVILSAQYGSERRHVDVTRQLREMARQDVRVRLDYRTFGVDPDEGHGKSLRIFARGPNGRERMFEYRDGSMIDGTLFRGWGRGEWGQGGWSGRWEGEEREEHEERERERDRQ